MQVARQHVAQAARMRTEEASLWPAECAAQPPFGLLLPPWQLTPCIFALLASAASGADCSQ